MVDYKSFISNTNLLELEENVKPKLELNGFISLFETKINESISTQSAEKAYCYYELNSLYNNRNTWFDNTDPMYILESGVNSMLFKNNEMFIISNKTLSLINESIWDSIESNWNELKDKTKKGVQSVASGAADTWNSMSDGAKKAYEVSKRMSVYIDKATNFLGDNATSIATGLTIASVISGYLPQWGQIAGPWLLASAGAIEVFDGVNKFKKSWEKLNDINISELTKAKESLQAGGPLAIGGIISLTFGIHDIISSPKAAVPGAAITQLHFKKGAKVFEESFLESFLKSENAFLESVEKGISNIIGTVSEKELVKAVGKFLGKGGSALGSALITALIIKIGRLLIGGLFDGVILGLKNISGLISTILSIPTKIAECIDKTAKSVESPIAKIIFNGLDHFLKPLAENLGKFLEKNVKPIFDSARDYFAIVYKELKRYGSLLDNVKLEGKQIVKEPISFISGKPVDANKNDLASVKSLPAFKVSENLLSYKDFILV